MNLTNDQTRELLSTVPFWTLQRKSKELEIRPARSHVGTVERLIEEGVGFSISYSGDGDWTIRLVRCVWLALVNKENFPKGIGTAINTMIYNRTITPSRR